MSTTIDTLKIVIDGDCKGAILEVDKLTASLNNLKKSSKLTTTVNNLIKLSNALEGIKVGQLGAVEKKLQVIQGIKLNKLYKDVQGLRNELNRLSKVNIDRINNKLEKTSKLSVAKKGKNRLLGAISGLAIGNYLGSSITQINKAIESANLFKTTMGSYYEEAHEWSTKVQDTLGIDLVQFEEAQGTFMAMAKGMGISAEQSYKLSKGLTEMAYDLASFRNLDVVESFNKLKSALAGEVEPLRAVGVSITQATLQEKAHALGIKEKVNMMTDAEKSLLRYQVILDSLRNMGAIGDMAKTLESPANALRILKMQLIELSRAIGSLFIPILTAVLPYVSAFVQVITKLIRALATLVGFKMPEWDTKDWSKGETATGGVANNLDKANKKAKELKRNIQGFDELHILEAPKDNTGGAGGLGGGTGFDMAIEDVWNNAMLDDINTKTKQIMETLEPMMKMAGAIGIAFLGWKLSKGFMTAFDSVVLGLKVLGGVNGANSASTLFFGPKATETLVKMHTMMSKTFIGGKMLNGTLGGSLATIGLIGISVGALAYGLVDVFKESERFREGIKKTSEFLDTAFATAFDKVKKGFENLSDFFGGVQLPQGLVDFFEALDLGLSDLLIALGGFGLFGPWGLAIEGGVLALKGLGYATSDAVERMDIFKDGISEATTEKVKPFISSIEDLDNSIETLKMGKIEINMTNEKEVKDKLNIIVKTIVDELDSDKNTSLQKLDPLKNAMSDEEFNSLSEKINESYAKRKEDILQGEEQIKAILEQASNEKRALTETEYQEISRIQEMMKDTGIKYLSESETESNLILTRLSNDAKAISLDQASTIIQNAIRCKEETIANAQAQYDGVCMEAQRMLDTGTITIDEYNRIVDVAEQTKNDAISKAEEQYSSIYNTAQTKLGDLKGLIDEETGEIKSKWEVWGTQLFNSWNDLWHGIEDNLKNTWTDMCTWFDTTIKPIFTKEYWDEMFKPIKECFTKVLKGAVNGGIEIFNKFISAVNDLMSFEWGTVELFGQKILDAGSITLLSLPLIQPFKNGGVIEDGLFTMNHGEIAGRFDNGQSVVANNEQIIEGIARGVANGLQQGNTDREININVDGRTLASVIVDFINTETNRTGRSPINIY